MWSKGFAAEETKAAFARVGELATEIGNAEAPLDAYFARWAAQFLARRARVGPGNGRELPARSGTRGAADGGGGRASHFGIDSPLPRRFRSRRGRICEQTLRIYDPERDREAKFRFGPDSTVAATAYLALAAWCFGDVARARELMDEAVARAVESAHAPTLANTYFYQADARNPP